MRTKSPKRQPPIIKNINSNFGPFAGIVVGGGGVGGGLIAANLTITY
jgi:hypothetical protein